MEGLGWLFTTIKTFDENLFVTRILVVDTWMIYARIVARHLSPQDPLTHILSI